ncbi:MAG: peptide deformylase [Alphaproteobacteria bacterium]|nr:peptide deformylase [Alphaproteobacteria bacterium]
MTETTLSSLLPDYVVINDPTSKNKDVLRTPAKKVIFPLDEETREILRHLSAKFDSEDNCAGLAAPQIGYDRCMIIFAIEEDEDIKNFRPDLTDTMPKSIWINPSWTPLSSETTIDWEACFSVADRVGRVSRFTEISYEAWTPEGKKIEGTACGFLARAIQHEVDHLNGKLYIDYVPEADLLTREEFNKLRDAEE